MNNPTQPKNALKESANVSTVVQEYMDTLLVELFPDVAQDIEQSLQTDTKIDTPQATVVEALTVAQDVAVTAVVEQEVDQAVKAQSDTVTGIAVAKTVKQPLDSATTHIEKKEITTDKNVSEATVEPELDIQIKPAVQEKPVELRYPKAPVWAQQAFDVLLFDVCGLKLAVPMESLGKIIKVDHETNQLIGRPSWFIGAYIEQEQHLYVVDTAQYIMPEKGFNLAEDGFDYVIQLQRSKWTLACKKVHNTVRLQPDQVKWRSSQGKRQWLSGTVVDHMCALIHVDSLIGLLEAEAH